MVETIKVHITSPQTISLLLHTHDLHTNTHTSMESHTTLCGSLKRHNMRRQYQRLSKVSATKDKSSRADIGCSQKKNSKIKPHPKKATPKSSSNLLGRLQDAYVEIMLRLAGNILQLNNGNVFLVQRFLGTPEVPT